MNVDDDAAIAAQMADWLLRRLAQRANGISGADIEFLVNEARGKARRENRGLVYEDIASALKSSKPEKSEEMEIRLAYHAAGHAVARICLGLGSISFITINDAAGSAFVIASIDCTEAVTEETLKAQLVVALAGRAAEQLCFVPSAGAGGHQHSDFAESTRLAFDMEMTLGFGEEYPLLYRSVEDPFALLAVNPKLAERVNRRLATAYATAREMVVRHQKAIVFLAQHLFVQETLEGEDLSEVLEAVNQRIAVPEPQTDELADAASTVR